MRGAPGPSLGRGPAAPRAGQASGGDLLLEAEEVGGWLEADFSEGAAGAADDHEGGPATSLLQEEGGSTQVAIVVVGGEVDRHLDDATHVVEVTAGGEERGSRFTVTFAAQLRRSS